MKAWILPGLALLAIGSVWIYLKGISMPERRPKKPKEPDWLCAIAKYLERIAKASERSATALEKTRRCVCGKREVPPSRATLVLTLGGVLAQEVYKVVKTFTADQVDASALKQVPITISLVDAANRAGSINTDPAATFLTYEDGGAGGTLVMDPDFKKGYIQLPVDANGKAVQLVGNLSGQVTEQGGDKDVFLVTGTVTVEVDAETFEVAIGDLQ